MYIERERERKSIFIYIYIEIKLYNIYIYNKIYTYIVVFARSGNIKYTLRYIEYIHIKWNDRLPTAKLQVQAKGQVLTNVGGFMWNGYDIGIPGQRFHGAVAKDAGPGRSDVVYFSMSGWSQTDGAWWQGWQQPPDERRGAHQTSLWVRTKPRHTTEGGKCTPGREQAKSTPRSHEGPQVTTSYCHEQWPK